MGRRITKCIKYTAYYKMPDCFRVKIGATVEQL